MNRFACVTRSILIVILATTFPLAASDPANDVFDRRAGNEMRLESQAPLAYGPSTTMLQIPASAFVTRRSADTYAYATPGYLYAMDAGSTQVFWAPLQLPTGAKITGTGIYYYDIDPDDNIKAVIAGFDGVGSGGTAPPNPLVVEDVSSAGSAGYGYAGKAVSPQHTVENQIFGGAGFAYSVVIDIPDEGHPLRFKSVEIAWERQISPAPSTATFNDVPLGSFGFQHIEALAASGITAGCGGGNFCPNNTLTRVEMAIFLAKGLGLHWPN